MAVSQEKISVYNIAGAWPARANQTPCAKKPKELTRKGWPDLKNTSDDAIPNYLNSLKIKQSHYLTDVRLALGYSALPSRDSVSSGTGS